MSIIVATYASRITLRSRSERPDDVYEPPTPEHLSALIQQEVAMALDVDLDEVEVEVERSS